MKILEKFPADMNDRDAYRLTKCQSVKKIQDAAGSVLNPTAWVLFEDDDSATGDVKTVLTIEDSGETFGTISATFIREFMDAYKVFGADMGAIKVVGGQTKAGRTFVTCELA